MTSPVSGLFSTRVSRRLLSKLASCVALAALGLDRAFATAEDNCLPPFRQTVVQPIGLIDPPLPYGDAPGALYDAKNVVMRVPGELWQAPGFSPLFTLGFVPGSLADAQCRKMFPLDDGHVYFFITSDPTNPPLNWIVLDGAGGVLNSAAIPASVSTDNLFSSIGQVYPIRLRDRMLVNTQTSGVLVLDKMAPATSTQRALRYAGMPQCQLFSLSLSSTNAGTLPGNVTVGYSFLLKRVQTDGYEIVGVPSPIYTTNFVQLSPVTTDPVLTIAWNTTAGAGVLAGDIIEIYRTDGILSNSSETDPGETLKLIGTHTLTVGDISFGRYVFNDVYPLLAPFYQTSGRELYTNPGQQTALGANRQPDTCNVLSKFKSYSFFGDITERARWTFSVPGGIGQLGFGGSTPNTAWWRKNGVGTRSGNGTITVGSAVITGISAAQLVGIVPRQRWRDPSFGFSLSAFVVAVGASSITMSNLATSVIPPGGEWSISDVAVINGNEYVVENFGVFILNLTASPFAPFEITVDAAVPVLFGNPAPYATGVTITLEPNRPGFGAANATITVQVTNPQNYQSDKTLGNLSVGGTPATFLVTRSQNLLKWSKNGEPEHVRPDAEIEVGGSTIICAVETKNAKWVFCTDGLYRLSGDVPPWRLDMVDPSCVIVAPQAYVQMYDVIYAYTNYGITAISDAGVEPITTRTMSRIFPGNSYVPDPAVIMERNETDDEIVVSRINGQFSTINVYNITTKAWTYLSGDGSFTNHITALAYVRTPVSAGAPPMLAVAIAPQGSTPFWTLWNYPGVDYLSASVRYQPFYGDDSMSMKQFTDCSVIFQKSDQSKTPTVTVDSVAVGSALLLIHNSDAYATVGIPRSVALAQSISLGLTMPSSATQFKFRGLSVRFAPTSNQAWRK